MDIVRRSVSAQTWTFDLHTAPHYGVTSGQASFFFMWLCCAVALFLRSFRKGHRSRSDEENQAESVTSHLVNSNAESRGSDHDVKPSDQTANTNVVSTKEHDSKPEKTQSSVKPSPGLDEFLQNVLVFGIVLVYFFLCDYRKVGNHVPVYTF